MTDAAAIGLLLLVALVVWAATIRTRRRPRKTVRWVDVKPPKRKWPKEG